MAKVSISRVRVDGRLRYRVNYCEGGKRKRSLCGSLIEAKTRAKELKQDLADVGSEWLEVPPQDRRRLIELWKDADKKVADIEIPRVETRTLAEAILELSAAKEAAGRACGYTEKLLIVLNQFALGKSQERVDRITLADVESFLDAKSLAYRSTLRARLSTLFNFCVRRGYCIKNPCHQLEPVTYHKPPPQIFTPEQLKLCLQALVIPFKPNKHSPIVSYRRGLTWFVLTTLCGLRPEEAQKTARDKIQCLAGHIIVDTQTTKVRERRVVTPMPEAMRWLRRSLKLGGEIPLADQPKKRVIHRLRKLLGFKRWPKDITRHTAASIWLARIKSAAEVAEQLGNSERILKRDYKALVTPAQLEEYLGVINSIGSELHGPSGIAHRSADMACSKPE